MATFKEAMNAVKADPDKFAAFQAMSAADRKAWLDRISEVPLSQRREVRWEDKDQSRRLRRFFCAIGIFVVSLILFSLLLSISPGLAVIGGLVITLPAFLYIMGSVAGYILAACDDSFPVHIVKDDR